MDGIEASNEVVARHSVLLPCRLHFMNVMSYGDFLVVLYVKSTPRFNSILNKNSDD